VAWRYYAAVWAAAWLYISENASSSMQCSIGPAQATLPFSVDDAACISLEECEAPGCQMVGSAVCPGCRNVTARRARWLRRESPGRVQLSRQNLGRDGKETDAHAVDRDLRLLIVVLCLSCAGPGGVVCRSGEAGNDGKRRRERNSPRLDLRLT
jgi:hypothetical protein